MAKGGLMVQKKEMTRVWVDNKFVSATLIKVIPQELLRYKTEDKDGYAAAVVGLGKKESKKSKGKKINYKIISEFRIDDDFVQKYKEGSELSGELLENISSVNVIAEAKGKGFQGVMKRFHTKGGPKTHGSKFHRQVGSLGNRKPRRVQKGHPHAGRMGGQRVTLKDIKVLEKVDGSEDLFVFKGSLPGAYNGFLKVELV